MIAGIVQEKNHEKATLSILIFKSTRLVEDKEQAKGGEQVRLLTNSPIRLFRLWLHSFVLHLLFQNPFPRFFPSFSGIIFPQPLE